MQLYDKHTTSPRSVMKLRERNFATPTWTVCQTNSHTLDDVSKEKPRLARHINHRCGGLMSRAIAFLEYLPSRLRGHEYIRNEK